MPKNLRIDDSGLRLQPRSSFGQTRWTVTAEGRIQSVVRVCGGRSGTGTDFAVSTVVVTMQVIIPSLIIRLCMTLYNLSK